MEVNQDVAARLVAFFAPVIGLWFLGGLFISITYHISLYVFDGEFRQREERMLDIFTSILRGLLYLFIWPAILYFDHTALYRIKMLFLYTDPGERASNPELASYVAERKQRRWVTRRYLAQQDLEQRRDEELETGAERKRRTRELTDGNPELGRIWLLTGVGQNPAGVSEIVRLYPDYWLAEEIERKACVEIELRSIIDCPKCAARVRATNVEAGRVQFLRVLEPDGGGLAVEGWALEGGFKVVYGDCPQCGTPQPTVTGDVSRFGKTREIINAVRVGLVYHWDLP